jgi:hypothetical protein
VLCSLCSRCVKFLFSSRPVYFLFVTCGKWVQNVIDAEAFLEGGDRDHTTSLLGDDYAHHLRAQEDFDAQKQQLQVLFSLFRTLNTLLPCLKNTA